MRLRHPNSLFALMAILAMAPSLSRAEPKFWTVFKNYYNLNADWKNARAKCGNCHTDPPAHTPYGKMVKQAMIDAGSPKDLTPAILASLETQIVPGDSWPIGSEIRSGLLPGDAAGHENGRPPTVQASKNSATPSSAPSAASTADAKAGDPLVPLHSFHPAVVHFPIALFLFGALLDLFGYRRKNDAMRAAGYWNILASALALAVVVPTGLTAFFRLGFPFAGALLTHFIFAVSASVAMIGICVWRSKSAPTSTLYWMALLVCAVLVGLAGHFGGNLVFG